MEEKDFLSQDLTGMFDDWIEESNDTESMEMLVDEEHTEAAEEVTTETTPEWDIDLSELDSLINEVDNAIEWAEEAKEEIKTTVENVQEAIANEDTQEVQKLVDQLYEQVLKYEADIETNKTRYDVLKSKFDDVSKQLEEANFKVEESSSIKVSSDPQVKILNRMFDDAISWSETAKKKVSTLLEDMYYKVTWETLEDKSIDSAIKEWAWTKYGSESTEFNLPEIEEDPEMNEWVLWIY